MKDIYKLKEVFSSVLEIDYNNVHDGLEYQSIPQWDSINQMFLISETEKSFDIEIDADDILEMKSFTSFKEMLIKYGLEF